MEENLEIKELWVDKYRPSSVDDMILAEDIKQYFQNMVKNRTLTNMTLCSSPGQGKTTICLALAKQINADVLFVKCAIEGKVETIHTKIKPFCDAMSMDGRPKIVILDELDSASATQDSSFQKSLRNVIESAPDTRFWATANYNKIIPAVLSRCPPVNLKFSAKDLLIRLKYILDEEKIKYTRESLKDFIKIAVTKLYPDIRSIINHLQTYSTSGELVVSESTIVETEKESFIASLIKMVISEKNLLKIRTYYTQNKDKIDDYMIMASDILNYALDKNIITKSQDILALSNQIYKLNIVVDKETQFYAFIVQLYVALH